MYIKNQVIKWRGAGWYAPCCEGSHDSESIVLYHVSSDRDDVPETYGLGLGTPFWYDNPEDADVDMIIDYTAPEYPAGVIYYCTPQMGYTCPICEGENVQPVAPGEGYCPDCGAREIELPQGDRARG